MACDGVGCLNAKRCQNQAKNIYENDGSWLGKWIRFNPNWSSFTRKEL
jgi:hypothetical protein